MICPKCKELGLKSKVFVGMSTSTLMYFAPYYDYYDEDGNYHYDDPNIHTTGYSCSNGHKFRTETQYGKTKIIILEMPDTEE